ncbi:zinc-binding alcohol dehydrogenase, partial [Candidatus Bathyarchaeota archaeon]|nr:zinc-binding alcohol dehydrogenase [Candidatus Bathyarchaeota archaeon]
MKQVALRSGAVTVVDVPPPTCSDNEVLVANAYSAISVGTELSTVMGSKGYSLWNVLKNPSLIRKASKYMKKRGVKKTLSVAKEFREASSALGYSTAGIVIAVGKSITDIGVGDRVTCAGGKANHAEIVSVPRNLIAKIPEGVSFEETAFTTLGAIAMHGVRRADIQFGENIVIFGVGLIGQLAVQIAKAAGCKVIAIDKSSN